MLTKLDVDASDERGTTLVELMVGLAVGMVVLAALTMVIIATLHGSARVSARVEATQRARVVLARIIEELHSACVAPKVAPILAESSGNSLSFTHAAPGESSAVAPSPIKSVISLEDGELSQADYLPAPGDTPSWTYSSTRQLITDVGPISPSDSIFTYYRSLNGTVTEAPPATQLDEMAAETIQVRVALTASPAGTPVADAGADASVQDSAALRLTPPSFSEQAVSLPCQ